MLKFLNLTNKYNKKKLTCLISGGIGNQLSMASLGELFAIENKFDILNFEYIEPLKGEKRICQLKKYLFSKKYKIFKSKRLIQIFYKLLIKINLLDLKTITWKGMKISLLKLPFKYQIEFQDLELGVLFHKDALSITLKNSQLISKKRSKLKNEYVIHYRNYEEELGLKGKKYQLKETYFINAIRMLKVPLGSKIQIICIKKPLNKFRKISKYYDVIYLTNKSLDGESALEKMRTAKTLIMSNSTLSWWGAYNNSKNPRIIVFPEKFTEGLVAWRKGYKSNKWKSCHE